MPEFVIAISSEFLRREGKMPKIAKITIALILLASSFGLIGCSHEKNTTYAPVAPPVSSPVFSPIKVELFIPYAPALNQDVDVTCIVSAIYDITDLTVTISSRRRVISPDGSDIEQPYIPGDNTTQVFNLKANQPVSFSSKIMFKETGLWRIDAVAIGYAPIYDKYWADEASLNLTVNADSGVMGWTFPAPPIYPKPPQAPPEAPAVLPDGTTAPVEKP
jgi:hypothetical protein